MLKFRIIATKPTTFMFTNTSLHRSGCAYRKCWL